MSEGIQTKKVLPRNQVYLYVVGKKQILIKLTCLHLAYITQKECRKRNKLHIFILYASACHKNGFSVERKSLCYCVLEFWVFVANTTDQKSALEQNKRKFPSRTYAMIM